MFLECVCLLVVGRWEGCSRSTFEGEATLKPAVMKKRKGIRMQNSCERGHHNRSDEPKKRLNARFSLKRGSIMLEKGRNQKSSYKA